MKIGVLGAGQLGRMLALAGFPLDFDFVFLDPATEACAAPLGEHIHADFEDQHALRELCVSVDVVTYEFENVPLNATAFVSNRSRLLPPQRALETGQDRLIEKQLFDRLDIAVPGYRAVDSLESLQAAVAALGLPCVLKTRRMGYDGKGQSILRHPSDLQTAWSRLGENNPAGLICEAFVAFQREVSCLAVRGMRGELAFYPLVENVHRDGILRTATPLRDDVLQPQAETFARRVLEHLDYVGMLAFEFFVADGRLLANEIAPRVHNSGHWTIEGAETSQFENHLRAIAGLPLGSTRLREYSAMVNFIGAAPDNAALAQIVGVHIHLYGKTPKPLRKVGHATVTAPDAMQLQARLAALTALADHAERAAG